MSDSFAHLLCTVVGLFTISCAVTSMFYGWFPIVVCILGLIAFYVVLRSFT